MSPPYLAMITKYFSRRSPPRPVRFLACLLCALVLPFPAIAAKFSLNPTRVELTPQHRTEVVTINNAGDAPLRMQARPMRWTMAADGAWQMTPSDELIVTPELIEIPPASSKQFRVGTLVDAGSHEASYRLLLDELPNLTADDAPKEAQIKVLTRVSLPVFLEPANATREPTLQSVTVDQGKMLMTIGDSGTQRLDPQSVKVSLSDRTGKVIKQHDLMTNYVLPGSSWPLHLKLATDVCTRVASVTISWPGIDNRITSQPITAGSQACEGTASH